MKRAFTLIELLIVVAIIAILAAIAVPNFLEAQTRSKVSRTKADLRSIGFAFEAYRLDNNWVPDRKGGGAIEYLKWTDYLGVQSGAGRLLTTPIAYMTNIPYDVFNTQMNKNLTPHHTGHKVQNASVFYRGASRTKGSTYMLNWPQNAQQATNAIAKGYLGLPTCHYILSSAGPNLIPWPQDRPNGNLSGANNAYLNMDYDPTNGTVSKGDIWMTDMAGIQGGGGR